MMLKDKTLSSSCSSSKKELQVLEDSLDEIITMSETPSQSQSRWLNDLCFEKNKNHDSDGLDDDLGQFMLRPAVILSETPTTGRSGATTAAGGGLIKPKVIRWANEVSIRCIRSPSPIVGIKSLSPSCMDQSSINNNDSGSPNPFSPRSRVNCSSYCCSSMNGISPIARGKTVSYPSNLASHSLRKSRDSRLSMTPMSPKSHVSSVSSSSSRITLTGRKCSKLVGTMSAPSPGVYSPRCGDGAKLYNDRQNLSFLTRLAVIKENE